MNVTPHNFWMPLKILLAVADSGTRRGKGGQGLQRKEEPLMNGNVNWFYHTEAPGRTERRFKIGDVNKSV